MKQAFVVVGPEGSGNRFVVRMLVAAGCTGSDSFSQPFSGPRGGVHFDANCLGGREKIAIHRSLPYGPDWPDLNGICRDMRDAGYSVQFLVMVREGYANLNSQLSHSNARNPREARDHYQQAYRSIFRSILEKDIDYVVVPYSSLGRPKFVEWLAKELGLEGLKADSFRDADEKYHDEQPLGNPKRPFGGLSRGA